MNLRNKQVELLLHLVNTEISKRNKSNFSLPELVGVKEQLILYGVVKSLPTKKDALSFDEWKKSNEIRNDNCGGYEWEGETYTAYSIEMMYKNYTM